MRAKPSSRTSRTSPSPSTWPCMMWPPSRSAARSDSSRLTAPPAPASPSEERSSVSCITSTANAPASRSTAVAVRHTPLTATESPSPISRAIAVAITRRVPSPSRSAASIVPRSWTSPVKTPTTPSQTTRARSPFPQPRRQQHVLAHLLHLHGERARGLGDPLHALALQRVARARAAEHDRRDEQPHLVDLAGVEEGAREVRAALEQDGGHAGGPELGERGAHARGLVRSRGDDHLGAGRLQRVRPQPGGGPGDDDGER